MSSTFNDISRAHHNGKEKIEIFREKLKKLEKVGLFRANEKKKDLN